MLLNVFDVLGVVFDLERADVEPHTHRAVVFLTLFLQYWFDLILLKI